MSARLPKVSRPDAAVQIPAHRTGPRIHAAPSGVARALVLDDSAPPPIRLNNSPMSQSTQLDRSFEAPSLLQASSLNVSSPHDASETEASTTAAKIMRMSVSSGSTSYISTATNTVFRLLKGARNPDPIQIERRGSSLTRSALTIPLIARSPAEATIQRQAATESRAARHIAANINSSISGGEPLPIGVRQFMEPRFGADFSNVRIHRSGKAAALNRQLNARAFTTRNQIFFGKDRFKPDTLEGKELIAHELTHTIQQGAAVQRAPQGVAVQRANDGVVHRSDAPAVAESQPSKIQRGFLSDLGIPDPFDWLAGKANLIPGFRMFTIILGVNPINMSSVDRGAANILRALVEFMPGGSLVTEALDNNGVFDKAATFVEQQVDALGMTGSAIKAAVDEFVASLDLPGDLLSPGATWARAERIFTGPIEQLKDFAVGLVTGIIALIKEAILKPIAQLAEGTEGYALLKAVLGKDPITDEPVPQTAESILGPFLKLIGQDEIWTNMQKSGAIPRAFAWFQGALSELKGFVSEIPGLFVAAFEALELADIILVPRAFAKLAAVFGDFLGRFISWVGDKIWKLLEIIFEVVKPGAFGYVQKTGAALKSILQNPLPFVGNLVKAAKLGFQRFAGNFLTHLKAGLLDWLTGSLPGVYIPKALTLVEFGKLALSVFGITWANIRAKIVKALGKGGEVIMRGLEAAFDVIKALVTGGPAAAWEVIKDKLTNLKDVIVGGIIDLVVDAVVTKAIPKLIAMFIPGAGFISAIVSIYDTIMVFVQKISKIIQVVTAFIDSIVAIAGGAIGAAAGRVESILAGLLALAINFLAGFAGLGKVASKLMGVINKVRSAVDKALDTAINFIVSKAKALFGKLFGKDAKDDRTPQQKQADLDKAMRDADALQKKPKTTEDDIRRGLPAIKSRYKMTSLNLVVDAKTESKEKVHIVGTINPPGSTSPTDIDLEPDGPVATFKIPRPSGFEITTAEALNPTNINLVTAQLDRRHIVSSKDVAEHYETVLVGKKLWSEAKKVLNPKQACEKPLGDPSIQSAAKKLHNRFFNDLTNLFVGPRGQNRSLGRRLDANKPHMTQAELQDHITSINVKYALEGTIPITL